MINTINDLLRLLHRYPSATRLTVGHNVDETAKLSGEIINGGVDEVILLLHSVPTQAVEAVADELDALSGPAGEAVEQCDRIFTLCDEMPERGEDFATEVAEKTQSIRDWIVEHDHVTDKQLNALSNMESGLERWTK